MGLIVLDLDGTLYPRERYLSAIAPQLAGLRAGFVAERLGIAATAAWRILRRLQQQYAGNYDTALEEAFGIERADYYQGVWGKVRAEVDADLLLRQVLGQRYRLALVTNAPEIWMNQVVERLGVEGMFAYAKGCDDGMVKPERLVFRRVCERLAVPAVQATAVGDILALDLEPAKQLGMRTVLVGNCGEADVRIRNIYDLEQVV